MKRFFVILTVAYAFVACQDNNPQPSTPPQSNNNSNNTTFPASLQPYLGKWYPGIRVMESSGYSYMFISADTTEYVEFTTVPYSFFPNSSITCWTKYYYNKCVYAAPQSLCYNEESLMSSMLVSGDTLMVGGMEIHSRWYKFKLSPQNANVEWRCVIDAPYPAANEWFILISRQGYPADTIPIVPGQTVYSGVVPIVPDLLACNDYNELNNTVFSISVVPINYYTSPSISITYTSTVKLFYQEIKRTYTKPNSIPGMGELSIHILGNFGSV